MRTPPRCTAATEDIIVAASDTHVYGDIMINDAYLTAGRIVLMNRFEHEGRSWPDREEKSNRVRRCFHDVALLLASEAPRDYD